MQTIYIGNVDTARLGAVWVAVSETGLVVVDWGLSREQLIEKFRRRRGDIAVQGDPARPTEAARQVAEYLEGKRRAFSLPLDWSSMGEFQQRTLRAVLAIPYGQTRSYGEIARQIGRPGAARAVGRANATNPMPLVIPCHRVLGADGSLRGDGGAGGVQLKQWLLVLEGAK